jgi:hypothetical protein
MPLSSKKPTPMDSAGAVKSGALASCFPPDELALLDAWIGGHGNPKPTRVEAVRKLVKRGLQAEAAQDASDRQRLGAFEATAVARASTEVAKSDATQIDRQINEGGPALDRARTEKRAALALRAKDKAAAAVDIALETINATDDEKAERKKKLVKRPRTDKIASS